MIASLRLPRGLLLAGFALLAACASKPPTPPEPQGPPPVGAVTLQSAQNPPPEAQALDVGVLVFTNQASEDEVARAGAAIFAEIRETETQTLPAVLRNTLLQSNQWGIVRVLPEADPSMDLIVSGTIMKSDGVDLLLHVHAVDSTGQVWLDKDYADVARVADYPDSPPSLFDHGGLTYSEDPFQDIYAAIANDLLAVRNAMDATSLNRIRNVTALRYASDLSPEAFASYLETDTEGRLTVIRLPASNDPLMAHVGDIKARHEVFIDTIDEYYEALYQDVKPVYDIWRQYSFEQVTDARRSAERERSGNTDPNSFEAISQNYNRYKWSKIFEQEFVALASGFVSETAPAVLELSRNVNGLTGPVEEQYAQWRVLLRGLFEIEAEGLNAAEAQTP
ncbi:MAG: hypothetical protein KDI28_04135 [Pseudomonadales bacterium]|nr:hypothetical protein [Pseudomonadales bacterium]